MSRGPMLLGSKLRFAFFCAVAVLHVVLGGGLESTSAAFVEEPLKVSRIVDGDTIHGSDSKGNVLKVRLHGMDTPELHLATEDGMVAQLPWGEQAERMLASLLRAGDLVTLRIFGKDKYGRTLGQVFLAGKNINLEQVRRGQAANYHICAPGNCTEDLLKEQQVYEFADACRKAQAEEVGIFDKRQPLEEMPFEFRLRVQKRKADKFVGDIRTREYVRPEDYKRIPVCERIFFINEQDALNLGFTLKKD
jgi:endonuclease YncB( thermonuclease family)